MGKLDPHLAADADPWGSGSIESIESRESARLWLFVDKPSATA